MWNQLKWSDKCVLVDGTAANQVLAFKITDTKLYVPVVTLSNQDNVKLLKHLESGFKRTTNWNKYQSKKSKCRAQNRYLDFLIDPSFQAVNRLFLLSFKDENGRERDKQYFLPTAEIKDYNVMIDERNFFDQTVKNNLRTYVNIRKILTGQGDDYTTGCFLVYPYFENYCKLIAIDLSKQLKLDADPKVMQQINFTGYLNRADGATCFSSLKKRKKQF